MKPNLRPSPPMSGLLWGEHLMQTADGFKRSEIGSTSTTLIWDGGDYLQGRS